MARGLFHKAIAQSGGSRDSVLTARPMREDGVDPNYPVSAETIGINFARSMGIEGTDPAALARLRALSAEQVLRGAPAAAGSQRAADRDDADPRRQADHRDGRNRLQGQAPAARAVARRKQQRGYRRQPDKVHHQGASSSPGSASGAPRRRRPTIPTERPSSPRWCRGPTTTSARPSRRASPPMRSRPTGRPPICTGSRTSRARCGNRCEPGRRTAAKSGSSSARSAARPGLDALARRSGGLPDGAELLGQLRQDRRPERCRSAAVAAARRQEGRRSSISGPMALRARAQILARRGSM